MLPEIPSDSRQYRVPVSLRLVKLRAESQMAGYGINGIADLQKKSTQNWAQLKLESESRSRRTDKVVGANSARKKSRNEVVDSAPPASVKESTPAKKRDQSSFAVCTSASGTPHHRT